MYKKVIFLTICLFIGTRCSDENIKKKDLVLVASESKDDGTMNQDNLSETSFGDDNNFDVFQATEQWQTVKEGQAIPPGLHVQIDLQTGQKQAKLLDQKSGESGDVKKQDRRSSTKQKYIKIDNSYISKQRLKDALKDFKDKFHNEDFEHDENTAHAKNKYRSMDELKDELQGADIWIKKDIEIIQQLVDKLNNSESTKTEVLKALEELEYFVHQIDNARDLDAIGGLSLVVNFLNQSDEAIQSHAALVVGSAAQSNIPVQVSLLESGALPLLMRLLVDKELSLLTRKKAMYALSSLLRLFSRGTQNFLKIGGLSHMASLFEENANDPLRIKALTLLVDLLTEQMDTIRKKAKEIGIQDYEKAVLKAPLLKAMYQEGWCKLATSFIATTDNETREKLVQAFQVLLPACRTNFKQTNLKKTLLEWRQEWLDEINRDKDDDTGYLNSLVKLVDDFAGILR